MKFNLNRCKAVNTTGNKSEIKCRFISHKHNDYLSFISHVRGALIIYQKIEINIFYNIVEGGLKQPAREVHLFRCSEWSW